MYLDKIIRKIEINESLISTIFGGLVMLAVGFLLFNYFGNKDKAQEAQLNVPSDEEIASTKFAETEWETRDLEQDMVINHLEGLNGAGEVNQETSNAPETLSNPSEGSISAASVTSYTVAPGDHLWALAERFYGDGYKWVEIARANNLSNPNIIVSGQELNMPSLAQAEGETVQTSVSEGQIEANQGVYEVQQGDHLWKIALDLYQDGFKWVEIWRANQDSLADPNVILAGQVLTLPPAS